MASETNTSSVRHLMRCRSCGSTSPAPLASPAYLRRSSQSGLRATSDLRVAVLSASGWMRGAALATAALPMTAIAASTARVTPTLRAVDDSSSATSVSSISSVAAISAKPKSMSQGRWSGASSTFARRRSRWAMRRLRISPTPRQMFCSTSSVMASSSTRSSESPATRS